MIIYDQNNNTNNRKGWKWADLKHKQNKSHCDHWSQSLLYLCFPRTVTTHGLVAFQVSDVWFRLQLFRTSTASVSVPAGAAVVASAAVHFVPTATAPFPSMYSALSSSDSCCRTFLRALLLLVDSLNKIRALIPARSRMLQKTATGHLCIPPLMEYIKDSGFAFTPLNSQSRIISVPCVEQLHSLFHKRELPFLFAHCANQAL